MTTTTTTTTHAEHLAVIPEVGQRVRARKTLLDGRVGYPGRPELAERDGTCTFVGPGPQPDVHVRWDGTDADSVEKSSYLIVPGAARVMARLRRLKAAGVLTDWFQHQQGALQGYWDLSGPHVRARGVGFAYVQGFTDAYQAQAAAAVALLDE
jgi:hypothetical protein